MEFKKLRAVSLILYGIVGLWSLIVLLPVVFMLMGAFKTKTSMFLAPLSLPESLSFASFERAWDIGVGQFLLNSFLVTGLSVALVVVASAMVAYILSREKSRLNQAVYLLIVAGFAVPLQAVLVPLFQILSAGGLLNSRLALVLPYAAYGIPFTVILFYAFLLDFPKELEEAARLDGCSQLQVFFKVILPLSGPAVASGTIFQAVFIWNEFILALLSLTSRPLKTLPVGMSDLQGQFSSDWPAVLAGLTIATLPLLLVFLFAQRYFVRSLAGLGK